MRVSLWGALCRQSWESVLFLHLPAVGCHYPVSDEQKEARGRTPDWKTEELRAGNVRASWEGLRIGKVRVGRGLTTGDGRDGRSLGDHRLSRIFLVWPLSPG